MHIGPSQTEKAGNLLPTIVWDGLGLFHEHSGIGSYASHLFRELNQKNVFPWITALPSANLSYCSQDRLIQIPIGSGNTLSKKIAALKPIFPVKSYAAAARQHEKIIYHGLSNINLPVFGTKRKSDKFVVTIHDIIPLLLNRQTALSLQMKYLLPKVVARADWVITGSNWTKNLLVEQFGAAVLDKISAVGYGVSTVANTDLKSKAFDAVMVSRGETYKRLDVFKTIALQCPDQSFALVTDVAGRNLLQEVPKNLKIHSHLTDSDLARLIQSSRIMIHPALYEGWCLPVADAVSYGLNVIFCSGSGIDEVCAFSQNTTIPISKNEPSTTWVEAFKSLIKSEAVPSLESKLPKWSEVASKTLKIYETLV